ncbi:uncharacterized protein LY89DRAFT_743200 [Mollisia scopiformis]|uniref:Uncharacterized protein n=1 Tax=Mollisia scopiformis TaxID=149040 RepID=A0A132B5D8_MOLSC|nr:uncharacterized protein LY89DRAFT_743200 [Mollisia scopiformis]KUJ07199.1 hypothetical protein LY89DRAFT_743200 [Mollisia scopiformis]
MSRKTKVLDSFEGVEKDLRETDQALQGLLSGGHGGPSWERFRVSTNEPQNLEFATSNHDNQNLSSSNQVRRPSLSTITGIELPQSMRGFVDGSYPNPNSNYFDVEEEDEDEDSREIDYGEGFNNNYAREFGLDSNHESDDHDLEEIDRLYALRLKEIRVQRQAYDATERAGEAMRRIAAVLSTSWPIAHSTAALRSSSTITQSPAPSPDVPLFISNDLPLNSVALEEFTERQKLRRAVIDSTLTKPRVNAKPSVLRSTLMNSSDDPPRKWKNEPSPIKKGSSYIDSATKTPGMEDQGQGNGSRTFGDISPFNNGDFAQINPALLLPRQLQSTSKDTSATPRLSTPSKLLNNVFKNVFSRDEEDDNLGVKNILASEKVDWAEQLRIDKLEVTELELGVSTTQPIPDNTTGDLMILNAAGSNPRLDPTLLARLNSFGSSSPSPKKVSRRSKATAQLANPAAALSIVPLSLGPSSSRPVNNTQIAAKAQAGILESTKPPPPKTKRPGTKNWKTNTMILDGEGTESCSWFPARCQDPNYTSVSEPKQAGKSVSQSVISRAYSPID